MHFTGAGGTHHHRRGGSIDVDAAGGNRDRQHVGQRRPGVAAFRQRRTTAEHNEAAAAHTHEVGQHAQLVGGEERGFDTAENDGAIAEQLGTAGGKAAQQIEAVAHAEAQELAFGAAHESYDLHGAVVGHGPPQERKLGARLTFEVQNAIGAGAHFEARLPLVVLRHDFARQ